MKQLFKALMMHSAIGAWLGKLPFLKGLYLRHVWAGRMDLFYGLFGSYAEAERFSANIGKVGWHDDALAELLVRDAEVEAPTLFQTSQFAVMLWLSKLLQPGSTVVDFGGAGGIFYELCARYGLLKPPLSWHVVDMPDMVERGRQRHATLGSTMISFGSELAEAPAPDIMLMLGMIQYLPDPFGEQGPGILDTVPALPEHILINKIPISDAPDAWTAQNHVSSVIPCRLFNRAKFLAYFEARGYRLEDRWLVPELQAEIPFHPERTLTYFEGFYLRRQA
ncbi:methyltransferase, TIGR04325 family [Labrys sp. ZIDIC5]|uniref:methyltransferase, TIGR04325 family n=1 Tax=Labrys sedimenti TaxID=3106036 RepID=UPI002ACAE4DA|nr:methyltransferase, TIGR04325 family [Labrys sp. ZIDIC5]MDZ5451924.1 methyltransferase, TIGR04325 family [Labrys sp. ZIDIC5]